MRLRKRAENKIYIEETPKSIPKVKGTPIDKTNKPMVINVNGHENVKRGKTKYYTLNHGRSKPPSYFTLQLIYDDRRIFHHHIGQEYFRQEEQKNQGYPHFIAPRPHRIIVFLYNIFNVPVGAEMNLIFTLHWDSDEDIAAKK